MCSREVNSLDKTQAIENWTSRIIGGQGIDRFNEAVRERRWAHYPGVFSQNDISSLFYTVDQLEADVGSAKVWTEAIDVFANGQLVRLGDLQNKTARSHLAVLIDQLRQGSMVRVRDLQNTSQSIEHTVRQLEQLFLAKCQVNLYLAPMGGAGFPAHFDVTDGFIIQCGGSKDWTIHEDYVDQTRLPTADTPWEPERYKPLGPGRNIVLHLGDVLYVPRGVMHSARCTNHHSLHLTVSLESLTYADVLLSEVRRLARDVADLRKRVPWTRDGHVELLTEALRDQMHMLADRIEAGPSLEATRRTLERLQDTAPGALNHTLTQPS